jgi:hypothetical protein
VSRRLLLLFSLAALAVSLGLVGFSRAAFTTTSQIQVRASTPGVGDWLHLYSAGTDPDQATGYAFSRLINGDVGAVAASGADQALQVDMGGFPDKKRTYDFPCVFSLVTPASFPDSGVGQVTVSVTLVDDGNDLPLAHPGFTPFGGGGDGPAVVQLGPGQKYQFNVTVQARKKYVLGHTYWPHVLIDVSVPGVPDGYFRYDIPVAVTDAGGT